MKIAASTLYTTPGRMAANKSGSKEKELQLPISRIRTIMKSSPDVENIGQGALYLVTRATVSVP